MLARIIHLTDLHLFVEPNGGVRSPSQIRASVRFFKKSTQLVPFNRWEEVVGGFGAHNAVALEKLQSSLAAIVTAGAAAGAPVVVLQTGDVETFGRSPSAQHQHCAGYPAFAFLRDVLWPGLAQSGATCVDLYGNHDVWAGTLPILTPLSFLANTFTRIRSVPGLSGPWPDRAVALQLTNGRQLHIYRLNTVAPEPIQGTCASGSVGPHPPTASLTRSRGRSAFEDLDALIQHEVSHAENNRPIRIVAMHHPPHDFSPSPLSRIGMATGSLHGAERLGLCAAQYPIHLIAAGHRHVLDPADDIRHKGNETGDPQFPLPSRTGQLVAESPTHDHAPASKRRNAFAVYDLQENPTGQLTVDRTVHEYRDRWRGFRALPSQTVFAGVPI